MCYCVLRDIVFILNNAFIFSTANIVGILAIASVPLMESTFLSKLRPSLEVIFLIIRGAFLLYFWKWLTQKLSFCMWMLEKKADTATVEYFLRGLSVHDSKDSRNWLEDEPLYEGGKPLPFIAVGDVAFPLLKHLMRSYPGKQSNIDRKKRIYNYRPLQTRREFFTKPLKFCTKCRQSCFSYLCLI